MDVRFIAPQALLTTLLLAAANGGTAAPGADPIRHPARVAHVIDATAYVLDVELAGKSARITVNLTNLQAPKIYGHPCERSAALDAKAFVRNILKPNDFVTVVNLGREAGQFVADIEFESRNLRDVLVQFRQVAQPGAPVPWCSAESTAEPTGESS